jgi:hypothetical protein
MNRNPTLIKISSQINPFTWTKMTNSMDMSSLTNALSNITITPAYQKELEAKKNGTYVNTYTAAQDKQMRNYCDNQGCKGPI